MTKSNNNVTSICILRLSALGDVTHVLPVIATLQNAYPKVQITWVVGKLEYKLVRDMPEINFIVFDKSAGRKGYINLKQALNNQTFDVLMQMQYSFRANRAAWLIKAKQRIGFDKKRSREFHGYKLTHRIQAVEKQHVLDGFMEFVKTLGVTDIIYQWNIATQASDIEFANKFIKPQKKNIIISPCSSNKLRNWSVANYAKIIDYIGSTYQANIIICASPNPDEIHITQQIEKLSNYPVTNIAGKDTLKQLYALMCKADLVISPDSGPMHIANAAATPVIGMHAATTAKRSGAYRYSQLAIDYFEQAAIQFLNKSPDAIRWGGQVIKAGVMDLIKVTDVQRKIDKALQK
ncbi:MAG: glycosyltransferase family 9 protein [Proteobacteria bacterium]|nr:glycosyltransferase family 9 protein [Pseudomonadota bacterium]